MSSNATTFTVSRFLASGAIAESRTYQRGYSAGLRLEAMAHDMVRANAGLDTADGHRVMRDASAMVESVVKGGMVSGTVESRGARVVITRTVEVFEDECGDEWPAEPGDADASEGTPVEPVAPVQSAPEAVAAPVEFVAGDAVNISADWLNACGQGRWAGMAFRVVRVRNYGPGRIMLDVECPDDSPWTVWTVRGVSHYADPAPEAVEAVEPAEDVRTALDNGSDYWTISRFPLFIGHNGRWNIHADADGYCAALPTVSGLAHGHKASHFGDAGYVRATLGFDVLAIIAALRAPEAAPVTVTTTWHNDNPDTIANRLAARLGRPATDAELSAEVKRILRGEAEPVAMVAQPVQQQQGKAPEARDCYVLMIDGATPTPLHLDARTVADGRRAIAWQERGTANASEFAITRYQASRGVFVCIDTGREFRVTERNIYTEKAFAEFLESLPKAPGMVAQQVQQAQSRDMRAAPAPVEPVDGLTDLMARIEAATGPRVVLATPRAAPEAAPDVVEFDGPGSALGIAACCGLISAAAAYLIAAGLLA